MTDPIPPARSLRIRADEVLSRLRTGEPILFLDARSAKAWDSSTIRVRGAVRVRSAALVPDPSWNLAQLIVIYCA